MPRTIVTLTLSDEELDVLYEKHCKSTDDGIEKHDFAHNPALIKKALHSTITPGKWIESNPKNSDVCKRLECSVCGDMHIVNINIPYEDWCEANPYCHKCGTRLYAETEQRKETT